MALWRKAEREVGHEKGLKEGHEKTIVDFVCRKLRKGKSAEIIAEELETDMDTILSICKVAADFAPDYDSRQVYEALIQREDVLFSTMLGVKALQNF